MGEILLKFEKCHGMCLSGYSSAVYGPTDAKPGIGNNYLYNGYSILTGDGIDDDKEFEDRVRC